MPFSWLICSLKTNERSVWTILAFHCETLVACSVKLYGVCDPHFIYLKVNEMWIANSVELQTQQSSGQHYTRSTNENTEKLLSGMNQTVSWYRCLQSTIGYCLAGTLLGCFKGWSEMKLSQCLSGEASLDVISLTSGEVMRETVLPLIDEER